MEGKVLKSVGSWYEIAGDDGIRYKGRLKGKFKMEDTKLNNPIAVGDKISFSPEAPGHTQVIIEKIHRRENYIIRKSAHKSGHAHIIASNIDEAFLVVTLVFPETSLGFIDRFLVAAESYGIPTTLIFNKADLYSDELIARQNELATLYQSIGYGSFLVSAEKETGIVQLEQHILGKTVLFAGHSGVGKSTLMNKIVPGLDRKTSAISNFANKGVHTTTFAEMLEIAPKTFLIDTPGIKEFGLIDIEKSELGHFFPEMRAMLGQCKFNSCLHVNEPGCAVQQAVEKGAIAFSRYKNYMGMLDNEDNRK